MLQGPAALRCGHERWLNSSVEQSCHAWALNVSRYQNAEFHISRPKGADVIIPTDWPLGTLEQAGAVHTLPNLSKMLQLYKAYNGF
jgi:hypothetical protein